jgi:O-antigen ligase
MSLQAAKLRTGIVWLLAAALFVLPFSSSIFVRNLCLSLALAGFVWQVVSGAKVRDLIPAPRLLLPIACWSLWCVASAAWSIEPDYSLGEMRPGLLYPAATFLLFYAATTDVETIDRWAWSLTAGLALLGLAAVVPKLVTGEWDPRRWHAGIGSYATHLVLAMPMLAWTFLRTPHEATATRTLLLAVGACNLAALWWLDSRIAWVALAAMTVLAVAISMRLPGLAPRRRALVAALVVATTFLVLFGLALQQRVPYPAHGPAAVPGKLSPDPRVSLWRYSVERIADAPWVGHGYGKGILRKQFRESVKPDHPLNQHGHNVLLNVTLQTGFVGLGLFCWMVAALVREMAAGLALGPPRNLAAKLGLVLLAGFAIRNMTDDFLTRHAALLAAALAGAALGALRSGGALALREPRQLTRRTNP